MSTAGTGIYTYTGVWINWSHGAIRGATLTLPRKYGGLLAAFLAIYVTFAGVMFWQILSYTLHQYHTTSPGNKRDGLHYQRQVILRNSGGAAGAFLAFTKLPLRWRGRAMKPFIRILPFAVLSALNIAFFAVASIFTSAVSSAPGNSTLILGPACGEYFASYLSFTTVSWSSKILADTYDAATYVRQCYSANTANLGCGVYNRQSLPFTVNPNASCPFASGLCLYNDHSAFAMDTGLLDSHADLGINAPLEHRILFRRFTTCAPIHSTQWITVENETQVGTVVYVNAGPSPPKNYTFSYVHHAILDGFGYTLTAVYALAGVTSDAMWKPDTLINRTDADITLMMLNQNDVIYQAVSDDPWMPAHILVNASNSSEPIYERDYDLNLLACAEQYQICNPNAGSGSARCTQLSGPTQVMDELASTGNTVDLNGYQQAAVNRTLVNAILMNMFYAVYGRGAAALNANEQVCSDIQNPIPSTQWHTEVSLWFSIGLAKLQSYVIEWATAPTNVYPESQPSASNFTLTRPYETTMCRNQLIRSSPSYQSFSILGLALIIALGGVIIVVGVAVDMVGGFVQRLMRKEWRDMQWRLEETLQLHRAAYDRARERGVWEQSLDAVPRAVESNVMMPPSSEIWGVGLGRGGGEKEVEAVAKQMVFGGK